MEFGDVKLGRVENQALSFEIEWLVFYVVLKLFVQ